MLATTAEEAGLLADVIAHPDEDGPRLVCADWYEDHGKAERAKFIRRSVGSGLAFYPESTGELPPFCACWPLTSEWVGQRGFVVEVRLPLATWMQHGPALVRAHPLERVELTDVAVYPQLVETGMATHTVWSYSLAGRPATPEIDEIVALIPSYHETADSVRAAISTGCLAWARGQVA